MPRRDEAPNIAVAAPAPVTELRNVRRLKEMARATSRGLPLCKSLSPTRAPDYTVKVAFALFLLLAASPTFEESYRAGLLALQRNDLSSAAANLGEAAKLAPNNGRVWVALAQTYWKQNDSRKADDAASKASLHGAGDPLVQSSLVIYYSGSGQAVKAAEAQARYATLVPTEAGARTKAESLYFEAVQPLLQHEKFGEAIGILTKAREQVANSAQLELALGVACYGLRRFDEAAAAFLRTIAISPDVDQPYIFLGKFLDQIPGKLPEVTRVFLQYENLHPASATGYLLHAKALNAQSIEPETARKLLEKAISIDARDAAAHFELGVIFDRARGYADAAREFERAADLNPADAATHYRLSRVYDRLGKSDAARRERDIHARLIAAEQAPR
jgi:tetratricopeptide (TPR) repeat protein